MVQGALSLMQGISASPNVILAIALTCGGSAAIVIGALATYSKRWTRYSDEHALVIALGFASGAVLSCAMSEVLPEAQRSFGVFVEKRGASAERVAASGYFMAACALVVGVVSTWALDAACHYWATAALSRRHSALNKSPDAGAAPAQCDVFFRRKLEDTRVHNLVLAASAKSLSSSSKLLCHVGIAKIVGFAAQNLLVGAALSIATMQAKTLGVSLGLAVALFNVAESMALARFVANAPGMRWRAVQWCIVSSFSLPLGGSLATSVAVMTTLHPLGVGALLSVASGILVGMSLTQVLPLCFTHVAKQMSRISASILAGVTFQAAVRSALLLLTID